MADEEEIKEYRWETGYEKTWEAIKEDDDGLLETNVAEIVARAKRRRAALKAAGAVKLGMMRHLFVIIDSSECMSLQDLKPTRYLCVLKLLENFINEFLDLNPISQMGILATKAKRCDRITELSGNKKKHLEALKQLAKSPCEAEPSLQNSLDLALKTLKNMPSHTSREILVLFGSLTTCDPTDIGHTIKALKDSNVRVSIIGLAAEVWVCRRIARETGGEYNVLLDDHHLKQLMLNLVEPPPAAGAMEASLIKMGFPGGSAIASSGVIPDTTSSDNTPAYCSCHMDGDVPMSTNSFCCPQCGSHYCELPVECKQCGLTLVSASHLARSYHHLFPIKPFFERDQSSDDKQCYSCIKEFDDKDRKVYQCETCQCVVCNDCDIFVRETLHTCPGCASHYKKSDYK